MTAIHPIKNPHPFEEAKSLSTGDLAIVETEEGLTLTVRIVEEKKPHNYEAEIIGIVDDTWPPDINSNPIDVHWDEAVDVKIGSGDWRSGRSGSRRAD